MIVLLNIAIPFDIKNFASIGKNCKSGNTANVKNEFLIIYYSQLPNFTLIDISSWNNEFVPYFWTNLYKEHIFILSFQLHIIRSLLIIIITFRYANSNLTWLQRQQLKLKERKEMKLREERQPHETRLISELRNVQSRHMRPTASHRLDGYTSDTTAFADDDEDFSIPLHINTLSKNKSPYSTNGGNERPFMAIKRAHERYNAQVGFKKPRS